MKKRKTKNFIWVYHEYYDRKNMEDVKMHRINSLILLIGSNPLPNYITAMVLEPEKLILIHSDETEEIADALKANLERKSYKGSFEKIHLSSAHDPKNIGIAFRNLFKKEKNNSSKIHLNYTGGTKVMAGQALKEFYSAFEDRASQNASYLNEKEEKIIFDNGEELKLKDFDLKIDLELLIKLHGFKEITKEKDNEYYSPALSQYLIKNHGLCTPLYELFKETRENDGKAIVEKPKKDNNNETDNSKSKKDKSNNNESNNGESKVYFEDILQKYGYAEKSLNKIFSNEVLDSFKSMESWQSFIKTGSEINIDIDGLNTLNNKPRKRLAKLLTGDWLEIFVKHHFNKAIEIAVSSHKKPETYQGISFTAENEMKTEVDLSILNQHRLFQVSCTTSDDYKMCKPKLFEVAARAKQLGGDLARFAILSLIDDKGLQKLKKQLETSFSSHAKIGYFGLEDLQKLCDNELSDKEKYKKIWKFLDLDN